MLEFEYPLLFLVALLPVLVRFIAPPFKVARKAIRAPFFDQLVEQTGQRPSVGAVIPRPMISQKVLIPTIWIFLISALVRPVWIENPITKIESSRDLLLGIDLSGSMEAEDFQDINGQNINRLEAVKQVVGEFISRRQGDRIGLILFGSAAFVQAPFTFDHDICIRLLNESQVRMAGPMTMIGDAIGLAIKLFEQSDVKDRVLILLTDGNDTGSKVPPEKAAEIAAERGVRMHTVAVGDPETVGENKIDEDALKNISNVTEGNFYRANDRQQLENIYAELDALEPIEVETLSYRPKRQLYMWPAGLAFVIFLVFQVSMAATSLLSKKTGDYD